MEDPIRFDVWGRIQKGQNQAAVQWIRDTEPWQSELNVRINVNKATTQACMIQIWGRKSWSQIEMLRAAQPDWLLHLEVFQEGLYYRKESLYFCLKHDLYCGGIGCHVCSGFYVP